MLKYFITSKARRNILKLLLTNPDKAFYTREASRLTGEPLNAVRRELGSLEEAGLLKSYRQGNLRYFKVAREFPFYPELKKIVYATVGLGDYLRERLSAFQAIEVAFIYGSVAKDTETAKSDIDLFIIGNVDEGELHRVVSQVEKDIGREINYSLMTKKEFRARAKQGNPFIRRVLSEAKLMLKGSLNGSG